MGLNKNVSGYLPDETPPIAPATISPTPKPVIGGLEIYLFGVIAAQGIAIFMDKKVDMFDSKNLAVIACILIIGLGGNSAFGGMIPFFGLNMPTIATAAIVGIGLNFLLSLKKTPKK